MTIANRLVAASCGAVLLGACAERTGPLRKAARRTLSITLDNGTEFRSYKEIEPATGSDDD